MRLVTLDIRAAGRKYLIMAISHDRWLTISPFTIDTNYTLLPSTSCLLRPQTHFRIHVLLLSTTRTLSHSRQPHTSCFFRLQRRYRIHVNQIRLRPFDCQDISITSCFIQPQTHYPTHVLRLSTARILSRTRLPNTCCSFRLQEAATHTSTRHFFFFKHHGNLARFCKFNMKQGQDYYVCFRPRGGNAVKTNRPASGEKQEWQCLWNGVMMTATVLICWVAGSTFRYFGLPSGDHRFRCEDIHPDVVFSRYTSRAGGSSTPTFIYYQSCDKWVAV